MNKTEIIHEWVEQYTEDLYNWAIYKTRHVETAEDLVQDVFHAAVINYDKFEHKSNPKTWLFSILKNKIADHFRKEIHKNSISYNTVFKNYFDENGIWHKNEMPASWPDEDHNLLDDNEFRVVLKKCLENLPSQWNALIQYKFLEEKNSKEVCQELGVSDTNYWQIIHRAKLQLRKCVELNWFKK